MGIGLICRQIDQTLPSSPERAADSDYDMNNSDFRETSNSGKAEGCTHRQGKAIVSAAKVLLRVPGS